MTGKESKTAWSATEPFPLVEYEIYSGECRSDACGMRVLKTQQTRQSTCIKGMESNILGFLLLSTKLVEHEISWCEGAHPTSDAWDIRTSDLR